MQAIILAAGMGKRLKELTNSNTKCMVRVNGVTLIDRMLHQLERQGLSRIIIVVGYEGKKLIDYINTLDISTPIRYINNPIYDKTNNIYSLSLAADNLCEEDTLLLESDLIFEDAVLDMLISDKRPTLALVDKYEAWMDGTCVKLTKDDTIEAFVPGGKLNYSERDRYYKTVNIYKFSKIFSEKYYVPFLKAYQSALGENEYYEQVLRVITMLDDTELRAKRLNGEIWYEIDDIQDLDIASSMFIPDEDERVDLLQGRYGGYWRYPKLMDFCYLVNPFFPPKRLTDEIKASFDTLITQYPSGMRVNALLAAKMFDVHSENIVVGNGAAELIRALLHFFTGNIGIVRPTFEEYSHSYDEEKIVAFWPENDDFRYDAKDIMTFFEKEDLEAIVLINPDNPSGNYIRQNDMMDIIRWTKSRNVKLVIDESFIDFSDECPTFINQITLNENPHVFVMKSISKSYGVPGLRLGVLASGDEELIEKMKKQVSIWNINSFAEFYMQIAEKYKKDYAVALERFRKERTRFTAELSEIDGLRVIPSQANYVMVELVNGISAKEFNRKLIVHYDIIVKNLVAKMKDNGKQYIRLAIKSQDENDALISAIKDVFDFEKNK